MNGVSGCWDKEGGRDAALGSESPSDVSLALQVRMRG